MYLKYSVLVEGIRPETLMAVMIANDVWKSAGYEMTLTSIKDSAHRTGSLHYKGWAVDIRTKDLPDLPTKQELIGALRSRLTRDYDIVFEDQGGDNEHLHVEFDPK